METMAKTKDLQEILQNSLTVKASDEKWVTLVPGASFRAVDSQSRMFEYLFLGRDFKESPHGEDYWRVKNVADGYVMPLETEWFRQRRLGLIQNPHRCLIAITATDSEWGTDYVQFTIPEGVDEEDVLNALEEAKNELEEDTSLVEEDDSVAEITDKIVERAAEIVCGTWRYVDVDEYKYSYDWYKWHQDREEENK